VLSTPRATPPINYILHNDDIISGSLGRGWRDNDNPFSFSSHSPPFSLPHNNSYFLS
jgi:hypothetical protein